MAKKGDWVRIHSVVLKAAERTAKIPEDTQKCDLEMWTKGTLQEDAEIGDEVTVITAANRTEKGTLIEVGPYYTHSYGKFVPEIIEIDKQLREIMFGGDK
ncbi:2-amino-4-oxopentanoate thiolase subunit OrtA [Emergencia timonensis]|uniref:2-amino-4-oxopentanoate thiolase subunit OrtA n=1 Tax=Emergencia timonensis TaxID=1776384 RepID=UPI0039946BEF